MAQVGYFHGYIDGVDFVFIDHPCFHGRKGGAIYGGSHMDIVFRCALLCKAALEAPWHVPCGGVPYGDNNLVFVANDWHTALLPVYLQVPCLPNPQNLCNFHTLAELRLLCDVASVRSRNVCVLAGAFPACPN